MTRNDARNKQAELKEQIDFLTEQHLELLEASRKIYRDIQALTAEKDVVDSRLEYDGTSFMTALPKSEPDSFEETVRKMMGLTIRK